MCGVSRVRNTVEVTVMVCAVIRSVVIMKCVKYSIQKVHLQYVELGISFKNVVNS